MNYKKRRLDVENLDRERGNCIQLYYDNVFPYTFLDETDQREVSFQFFQWFLNLAEPDPTKISKPGQRCLQFMIDAQKRHVEKVIAKHEKDSRAAKNREAEKKALLAKAMHMPPEVRSTTLKGTPRESTPMQTGA